MTIEELLEKATADGLTMRPDGDELVIEAPTVDVLDRWKPILKDYKPALLQRLTTCKTCGGTAWRETPDGGRWCGPCVIAGRVLVVAVKIWSDKLDAPLWMVADDLPRDQWPQDAPVYTYREIQQLRQTSPDVLQWVHVVKAEFEARVAHVKTSDQERVDHR